MSEKELADKTFECPECRNRDWEISSPIRMRNSPCEKDRIITCVCGYRKYVTIIWTREEVWVE